MILSPQNLFFYGPDGQTVSDDRKRLYSAVSERWFQRALSDSLAQLVANTPATDSPQKSCDVWNQIIGAKRFIDTLLTLAEQRKAADRADGGLNYDA